VTSGITSTCAQLNAFRHRGLLARTVDELSRRGFVFPMFTIIGGDGKEYGPATADQIRSWIAAGRANLDTKAKAVGSEEWRRLGDYAEFSSPPPLPSAAPAISVPPSAPERVTGPVDARTFAAELSARAAPLDVFGCLGRSFELWKSHFLPLVGVTLLIVVLQVVAGLIPILGFFAGLLLNGVFYGGLYYYYLGLMRGQPRTAGDAFAGFTKALGPLMLANVLITFLTLGLGLIFFGPWLFTLFREVIAAQNAGGVPPVPTGASLLGFAVGMLAMLFVSVCWVFTFPLIIDRGLGPWTAMSVSMRVVTKQWFRVFFVMLLAGILAMLGMIALLIGMLLTLPLLFGAILYAYEDLCNPPTATPVAATTLHAP
jgi:hypothetical protein